MATLYDLTGDYKHLMETLDEGCQTPEALEEVIQAFAAIQDNLYAKLETCARVLRNLRADSDACRAEARRLEERARAKELAANRFKDYVATCFENAGLEIARVQTGTFYWHTSTATVIEDASKIPEPFVETLRKPKLSEIRKALLEGTTVEGAALDERRAIAIR